MVNRGGTIQPFQSERIGQRVTGFTQIPRDFLQRLIDIGVLVDEAQIRGSIEFPAHQIFHKGRVLGIIMHTLGASF